MRWNLALAGLAASWGFIAVLAAAVELGAEALAFWRLALAAVTLGVVALVARRSASSARGRLAALALLGVVQGAHWLLFFEAVKHGSVALAVLTFYAAPLLIALARPSCSASGRTSRSARSSARSGSPRRARRRRGRRGVARGGRGGARLGRDVRRARDPLEAAPQRGDPAAHGRVLGLPRRRDRRRAGAPARRRVLPDDAGEWGAVLLLGIVFTGVSTLVYAMLLRHVTAQAAGVLTFLEPVAAVLLAWAILDERPGAATLVGGALVVAAGSRSWARARRGG